MTSPAAGIRCKCASCLFIGADAPAYASGRFCGGGSDSEKLDRITRSAIVPANGTRLVTGSDVSVRGDRLLLCLTINRATRRSYRFLLRRHLSIRNDMYVRIREL
ncbi:hypothetical protein EVAR_51643_1 [Eumeta japonica]|uniref:Uncharacterized protein n=1 Tax=Eumeta variegata TaxID=151549 RepID=A0A4C1YIT3_EUMVA|nr:hypothetical protein EVAR_51643_1 [Eumeta japonica]